MNSFHEAWIHPSSTYSMMMSTFKNYENPRSGAQTGEAHDACLSAHRQIQEGTVDT